MTLKLNYRAGLGLAALAAGVLLSDMALAQERASRARLPPPHSTKATTPGCSSPRCLFC